MQEILGNVKNTAMTTGVQAEQEDESIYESDPSHCIANNVQEINVGDFYIVYGTEANEFDPWTPIPAFPDWMELRIRCNKFNKFVVFYPKGMVTFEYLKMMTQNSKKQFKCEILRDEQLGYKIWRSK